MSLLGLRRKTQKDKEFADFDLFDDPATPYSTFNFKYPHLAFDRLSKLTEFNTLLHIDAIKKVMAEIVQKKRAEPQKCPCKLEDVPKLRRVSQKNKKRLSTFVSRIKSGRFSRKDAARSIDKTFEEIQEEKGNFSVDIPDGPTAASNSTYGSYVNGRQQPNDVANGNDGKTFRRKGALSKKSPLNSKSLNILEDKNGHSDTMPFASVDHLEEAQKRDIPGRRKPQQPEKARLWQDSKCNSIDDNDEDQFFTAVLTPSQSKF